MWFILIIAVLLIITSFFQGNSNIKNFERQFGYKISELIPSGTYVSGHPQLDNSFINSSLVLDKEKVKIFELPPNGMGFVFKSAIQKKDITNVVMEDASTIQKRVTVGRLLLTGIFAFAWKKKEKIESAYLIIEWNQAQFKNETIFEFEGKGSIEKANTLRNKFINYLTIKENDIHDKKYLELINDNKKIEAINLYCDNNDAKLDVAQNYIENLINRK